MNTNRFESPKLQTVKRRHPTSVGPAWWCLAIGATLVFVVAILFLTRAA